MRKWRHDYLSKNSQMSNVDPKSDRGITLVELLASLAILSVVILLAGSVHLFGQRQFISQTESASTANDMSYALSVMSRDLRKQEAENVIVTDEGTTIEAGSELLYTFSNNQLKKNGSTLIDSVSSMKAEKIGNDSIEIIIKSSSSGTPNKTYQTTIYFRR